MKISLNWLKDWLPLELDARELSGRLTSLGFEVSSLEKRGPAFRGVVAAKILEVSKHPNADRLRLCLVDDGTSRLTVVCGAANVAAGQLVPLARVGATLPGGRTLSAAKIRGVESQGMLCSAAELGLSGDHSGILQLPPTPLGGELAETLGPADEVLDVEVTPNRPDCLSHRGLARELAAFLKLPLKQAPASTPPAPAGQCPQVSIEAAKACPLYCARLISGVTVGPSPAWLAAKLEAVGLRPINNVVDVTNYVLLDLGQPLHAFDAARLAGPGLRVRFARAGESLAALDGKPYALSAEILVIADSARPVAIAGVMGGLETGVTEKTTSVILESACFAPPDIRRASRRLRLRSDSSYRFERGVDPEAVLEASERAAALIARLGGKGSSVSAPGIAGAPPPAAKPIQASAERINGLLGSSFPEPQIEACLRGLGRLHPEGPGRWLLAPRSYRRDLESAADLAEEVARLAGYDSIPSQAAPVPPRAAKATPYESLARRCRSRLSAAGLLEACNYDFVCEKTLRLCGLSSAEAPRLANPVSDEWTLLRPSLLPGLLQNAAGNLKHGAAAVKLFELGAQYARRGQAIEERRHLAGLLLGPLRERCWKPELAPDLGFHDAKGLAQDLLSGLPALKWTPLRQASGATAADPLFHPAAALRLELPEGALGTVGLLHPTISRAWGLERQPVALLDLDLERLLVSSWPQARFAPYSQFPASWRDLSLLADKTLPYAELEAAARGDAQTLRRLDLVDVYAGKGLPAGKRGLTLRLTFGRMDRTLTDAEVDSEIARALERLKAAGAELRR